MKAKDIFKMWSGNLNTNNYELYLHCDNKMIGQTIDLTLKRPTKNFYSDEFSLDIDYQESFTDIFGHLMKRDIRNSKDSFFLNLRARKLNGMCVNLKLSHIDLFNEIELSNFDVDGKTIIFVYRLKKGV